MKLRTARIKTPGGDRFQVQFESNVGFNNRRSWKVVKREVKFTHTYHTEQEAIDALASLQSTVRSA